VTLEFYTLLPDGTRVGVESRTLAPRERLGRLYRELLPASLGQVGGWALVRSSADIVGAVLFGGTNGLALANVPAETAITQFVPPDQVAAAITGTIRQDGFGVGGVTVELTGPVTTTRESDPNGQYVFGQLPPGDYTIRARKAGGVFAPEERTVTLERINVNGQDFAAGGVVAAESPAVTFMSPASTFTGNSLLNLTLLGQNFNPTSVVRFGDRDLQTTYVSGTQLQAVVPGELLRVSQNVSVTVTTPPPGGGVSIATLFVVNPVPENPLIVGRVPVGAFPAGVAIHS
jgi:hypothetical protein